MKHKAALFGASVLLAGVVAVACSSAASPDAARIQNRAGSTRNVMAAELRDARKLPARFREDHGKIRLVVLLSPT
ncbi:MAG: hypothetical protein O7H41_16045 [Planctomycetota bacterium]|nr:hypothetical protein [Planctomycetota bacterium]